MSKQMFNGRSFMYFMAFLLSGVLLILPGSVIAGKKGAPKSQGKYWDVSPEAETPSPHYDSILYSEIAPKLREIEKNSNRVKVDVIGQSAGGRDLFLVTLSAPEAMGRLGRYQAIRKTMLKDPEKAQAMIDKFGDFKVPVFINGSIHGDENTGVDAAIRLIETLAYSDTEEVNAILKNVILLVNVVQNPDGRVNYTRSNINGFDINRDFATQSQPETRATVKIFTEWNPMVVLDLHGFVNPMLIEPCTPPHNSNYEYDLYIKWAYDQALAMEQELIAQTDELEAIIPYRDWDLGWDDWSPIYVPMYAMYHGAYGHTLETPHRDARGVDAHYAAVWGALKFVAENREGMIRDQVEIYRRGFLDLPQMPIPPELLPVWDQYQDLIIQDFPAAYVIPKEAPFQISPHQSARLVEFLLFNDVQVEQASQPFTLNGVAYPQNTYVVWMDQPKRGLANTILSPGPDLSDIPGLYFYSPPSVWSQAMLWGADCQVMKDKIDIKTKTITKADSPKGSLENGGAAAYAYLPTSIDAFKATNTLLRRGVQLHRMPTSFLNNGREFGAGAVIIPASSSLANELANQWKLDIFALSEMPQGAVLMKEQKIAVYGDEGVIHSLKTLGFDFDEVSASDLNGGIISGYDLFLNRGLRWASLDEDGKASVLDWFAANGDYVGLGDRGRAIDFAVEAGLIDVDYGYIPGNAIIKINYNPAQSVAAGFRENGYGFVYRSVWFKNWPAEAKISGRIDDGEFLVSGFWEAWQTSGAQNGPVILHWEKPVEDEALNLQDTILIGIDATFRGHPENTFRLIGNAIYSSLD